MCWDLIDEFKKTIESEKTKSEDAKNAQKKKKKKAAKPKEVEEAEIKDDKAAGSSPSEEENPDKNAEKGATGKGKKKKARSTIVHLPPPNLEVKKSSFISIKTVISEEQHWLIDLP